jgi:light-regulated signal transduction histidine kinase (bacteriophytochrome)
MDITDRQQVEEQLKHYAQELERSNQALEDFAFVASHDLQEPLRKIILFGNNLRQRLQNQKGEAALDETASDYLDRMQNAAGRMQSMIQGLLELSRVNTHGASFTPVNLNQVMADVIADLEVNIQSAGGQVEIEDLPTVEADALQMRQLFQNLIGNAIKFHKPDVPPVVHVTAVASDQKTPHPMIAIQIEDNGIGFEQQFAAQIFQPFQRLHGRREYEGTGLGLAICQKIVERHNGMIEVQSVPEQGTKFTVHLPPKIM